MMAASVMFSMSGVNKRRFIEAVKADPQQVDLVDELRAFAQHNAVPGLLKLAGL